MTKIIEVRSLDLVERINNNTLSDEDKINLIKLFAPKIPYHEKPEVVNKLNDYRRDKYRNDEEYRAKRIELAKAYHRKKQTLMKINNLSVGQENTKLLKKPKKQMLKMLNGYIIKINQRLILLEDHVSH